MGSLGEFTKDGESMNCSKKRATLKQYYRGHIVQIIILPDDSRWVVDVCFGGDGPTQPMRLSEGFVVRNMGTQDARFIRDFIPGQSSCATEHKMWQYQCRNNEALPWQTYYSFSDMVEWLTPDFVSINHFTSSSLESSAVTGISVVKFLRRLTAGEEEGDTSVACPREEVYGKRILVNALVKENLGGRTVVVQECRSEQERIAALWAWFGMELTKDETTAIQGHITELRG